MPALAGLGAVCPREAAILSHVVRGLAVLALGAWVFAIDDHGHDALAVRGRAERALGRPFGLGERGAGHERRRKQGGDDWLQRSEEHTSELQSLMRISYAVFCLKKKTQQKKKYNEAPITQTHTKYKYTNRQ